MKEIFRFYRVTITIFTVLAFASACSSPAQSPQKITRETTSTSKQVEIFDISEDKSEIKFTKNGIASAEDSASISAEVSGRITGIKVSVGDTVRSGQTLITLGDSLGTDISNIQSQTASQAADLAQQSAQITYELNYQNIIAAESSYDLAEESYQNSVLSKKNAKDIYELQRDSLEDTLDDAEDNLDDLEDELDDLEDDPDATDDEIESLEDSIEIAEKTVDQAENALDLMDANYKSQSDQLNLGVRSAYNQLEQARIRLESAYSSAYLQDIGSQSQILQSESGESISKAQVNAQNITSPISGVVTEISAKENNFVSPGQPLIKVKGGNQTLVETSLNEYEAGLLKKGDSVEIEIEDNSRFKGNISYVSPSLNEQTHKIDIEISSDSSAKITSGSFVKIYFTINSANRIFIPFNSVFTSNEKTSVRLINDKNEVELREVEIGEIIGSFIEIKKGLKGNEQVVTTRSVFLEEGDKVEIK